MKEKTIITLIIAIFIVGATAVGSSAAKDAKESLQKLKKKRNIEYGIDY